MVVVDCVGRSVGQMLSITSNYLLGFGLSLVIWAMIICFKYSNVISYLCQRPLRNHAFYTRPQAEQIFPEVAQRAVADAQRMESHEVLRSLSRFMNPAPNGYISLDLCCTRTQRIVDTFGCSDDLQREAFSRSIRHHSPRHCCLMCCAPPALAPNERYSAAYLVLFSTCFAFCPPTVTTPHPIRAHNAVVIIAPPPTHGAILATPLLN